MKRILLTAALSLITGLGSMVASIDTSRTGWLVLNQAEAHGYGTSRRVARRTSRRTSRRVSRRHNYAYGAAGVAVAGAAVVTAVAIGTVVTTLPAGCNEIRVNGVPYHNCGTTYYQPRYEGQNVTYIVVEAP